MVQFMICLYTKVEDYNKTGSVTVCPRPKPQAASEHCAIGWTDVHKKSVKVEVSTL